MKQIKAFTICDAGYIDAGIVAITSFLKFNKNIPLVVFMEDGTNCRRLQEATEGKNVEIRPRTFPELRGHHIYVYYVLEDSHVACWQTVVLRTPS